MSIILILGCLKRGPICVTIELPFAIWQDPISFVKWTECVQTLIKHLCTLLTYIAWIATIKLLIKKKREKELTRSYMILCLDGLVSNDYGFKLCWLQFIYFNFVKARQRYIVGLNVKSTEKEERFSKLLGK